MTIISNLKLLSRSFFFLSFFYLAPYCIGTLFFTAQGKNAIAKNHKIYPSINKKNNKKNHRHTKSPVATDSKTSCDPKMATDFDKWKTYIDDKKEQSFKDVATFIRAHPDWPKMDQIQICAENAITAKDNPSYIKGFFEQFSPISAKGAMIYARILKKNNNKDKAKYLINEVMSRYNLRGKDLQDLLSEFGLDLEDSSLIYRINSLFAAQDTAQMQLFLEVQTTLLNNLNTDVLFRVKPFFETFKSHVFWLRSHLPPEKSASSTTYMFQVLDYLRFYRTMRQDDLAIALCHEYADNPKRIAHEKQFPTQWSNERRILARRLMEKNDWKGAHDILLRHEHVDGVDYANTQFLIAFLKLKRLNQGGQAFDLFKKGYQKVKSPISLGRMAFWAAEAARSLGNMPLANQWYNKAYECPSTYYGMLAKERLLSSNCLFKITNILHPPHRKTTTTDNHHYFKVLKNLIAWKADQNMLETFGVHFFSKIEGEKTKLDYIDHILKLNRHWGVSLIKKSMMNNLVRSPSGYPTLTMSLTEKICTQLGVSPTTLIPLTHAVIRQESNFSPFAVSTAGAKGLMQVIDKTAAKEIKEWPSKQKSFDPKASIFDPIKNVSLGMVHLHRVIKEWGNYLILGLACYNAGPTALREWIDVFGDPRDPACDIVDWVELIPFGETRDYVQRCLEGYLIYQELFYKRSFNLLHLMKNPH